MARKPTDTVQLKLRFSERLRRRLEQAAKHNDWSMNAEIVNRLDTSFQKEAEERVLGGTIEQAVNAAATGTARRLVQELRQSGLIPEQMARPQEATEHPAPPDKEEKSK